MLGACKKILLCVVYRTWYIQYMSCNVGVKLCWLLSAVLSLVSEAMNNRTIHKLGAMLN